jgi:cell division protease FtsH
MPIGGKAFTVQSRNPRKKRFYRQGVFWVGMTIPVLLALYVVLLALSLPPQQGKKATLAAYVDSANAGTVSQAKLLSTDRRVLFEDGKQKFWMQLPDTEGSVHDFVTLTLDKKIPLDVDAQTLKALLVPASWIVPALVIAATFLLVYMLTKSRASTPFVRAAARRGAHGRRVTFADIAGIDDAVVEAREIRDYLVAPERFREIGAEPPRGVLFVGPPGTGKTLLARAVAGEASVPFYSMSGTDFVEMYVGVGAARVRDLFARVRESAPSILFIDELDAVGRTRAEGAAVGQEERDQTLNQLLVELDGFDRATGVVMIGATNRPDVLDPALLRRGRFDRRILIDRPDRAGRRAILEVHARGKRLDPAVDLDRVASHTAGLTGADLASVLNEAALLSARRGRVAITAHEIEDALDRTIHGSEGRAQLLTPDEKRIVAYHEAGHAIVGLAFADAGPVRRVSIVSRGRALGSTDVVGQGEQQVVSRRELEHRMAVVMGGRAAEELVLESPTAGSGSDLRQATSLARRMVCEFGMSELLGRRVLGYPVSSSFLGSDRLEPDYSPEVATLVDREIGRLVDEGFELARRVLERNRARLDELAAALVDRETLREDYLAEVGRTLVAAEPPRGRPRGVSAV